MRKILFVLAVLAVLGLGGCSKDTGEDVKSDVEVETVVVTYPFEGQTKKIDIGDGFLFTRSFNLNGSVASDVTAFYVNLFTHFIADIGGNFQMTETQLFNLCKAKLNSFCVFDYDGTFFHKMNFLACRHSADNTGVEIRLGNNRAGDRKLAFRINYSVGRLWISYDDNYLNKPISAFYTIFEPKE